MRNSPSRAAGFQQRRQPGELVRPQPPRRRARQRRHRRAQPDQRRRPAAAEERKLPSGAAARLGWRPVIGHPGPPAPDARLPGHRHRRVMVAGNGAHPRRRAEPREPIPRRGEFPGQGEVGQIASDRDMVGPVRRDVGEQRLGRHGPRALAQPAQIGQGALPRELGKRPQRPGGNRQVWIGEMGESEVHGRPGSRPDSAPTPEAAPAPPAADATARTARLLREAPVPVWSMPGSELLRRALARAGVQDVARWDGSAPVTAGDALLLLRADHVFDAALVAGLAQSPGVLLRRPEDGLPVAAHLPRTTAPSATPPPSPRRWIPAAARRIRPSRSCGPRHRTTCPAPTTRRSASAAPPTCCRSRRRPAATWNGGCSAAPTRASPTSSPSMSGRFPPSTSCAPAPPSASRPTW